MRIVVRLRLRAGRLATFPAFLSRRTAFVRDSWGCTMKATHQLVLRTGVRSSNRTFSIYIARPRRTSAGLEALVPSPVTPAGFILDRFAHCRVVAVRPMAARGDTR